MNLGNKIVEIRKKNKMSQEEFAEIFNVTRQTISSWENSKSYPDIETLVKLSDRFDISLDILLKEDIEMIKKIDNDRKNYKKLKISLLIIIILIIIGGTIYTIDYISFSKEYEIVKEEIETKYYKTLDYYKFKKENRLYTLNISDNTKFITGSQEMPMKRDRVLHFYAKFLYAYIDKKDSTIEITFNDFNEFYLIEYKKDKNETLIFSSDKLKEEDKNNVDIISNKIDYDKEELENILNQGYKIYEELYTCELCK